LKPNDVGFLLAAPGREYSAGSGRLLCPRQGEFKLADLGLPAFLHERLKLK
jgi:hypothetical protein